MSSGNNSRRRWVFNSLQEQPYHLKKQYRSFHCDAGFSRKKQIASCKVFMKKENLSDLKINK